MLPNTSTPRDPEATNARVVRKRVGGGYKYIIEKIDDKDIKEKADKEKEKTDEDFIVEVRHTFTLFKMETYKKQIFNK